MHTPIARRQLMSEPGLVPYPTYRACYGYITG